MFAPPPAFSREIAAPTIAATRSPKTAHDTAFFGSVTVTVIFMTWANRRPDQIYTRAVSVNLLLQSPRYRPSASNTRERDGAHVSFRGEAGATRAHTITAQCHDRRRGMSSGSSAVSRLRRVTRRAAISRPRRNAMRSRCFNLSSNRFNILRGNGVARLVPIQRLLRALCGAKRKYRARATPQRNL